MNDRPKRLTLIRHAQSEMPGLLQDDWQRCLTPRGEQDAVRMGQWLLQQNWPPDALWHSDAVRAGQTCERIVAATTLLPSQIVACPALYLAELTQLLQLLSELPDHINHLALIGHNPGLTELATFLGSQPIEHLATCAVCELELPCARWGELVTVRGTTVVLMRPKLLPASS